jgi:hypothetical protein
LLRFRPGGVGLDGATRGASAQFRGIGGDPKIIRRADADLAAGLVFWHDHGLAMNRNRFVLFGAIAASVLATLLMGTVYGVAQQIERRGADDAAWRLASQVVSELTHGRSDTLDALPRVDLEGSLAPFVVVFDATDAAMSGNGYLGGVLASVPKGVLDAARAAGQNHVSWQPSGRLRFATVEVRAGNSVVLAGQSLALSESRTDDLGILLLAAWAGTLLVVTAGAIGCRMFWRFTGAAPTSSGNR